MFRSNAAFLKFKPKDGMKVIAYGDVRVYTVRGYYQIYIRKMEPEGYGALYLKYLELKNKLEKEGLFDASRKRQLPRFPKSIGIVTSKTGAALHDMIRILKKRMPSIKIYVADAQVQGQAEAAKSIVNAINLLNKHNKSDIIIVGRGGGSIEDLWVFNTEPVARAIASSKIPVISAVGHETDFLISDFVADMRAPTPSAAAELVVPDTFELKKYIQTLSNNLKSTLKSKLEYIKSRYESLKTHELSFRITRIFQEQMQLCDELSLRMSNGIRNILEQKKLKFQKISFGLSPALLLQTISHEKEKIFSFKKLLMTELNHKIHKAKSDFKKARALLASLSPFNILNRGYAFLEDENKNIITTTKSIEIGMKLNVNLADGTLVCKVLDKINKNFNSKV